MLGGDKIKVLLIMDIIAEFSVTNDLFGEDNTFQINPKNFAITSIMQYDFPIENVEEFDLIFLHARSGNKAIDDGEFIETVCKEKTNLQSLIIWDESGNHGFGQLKRIKMLSNVVTVNNLAEAANYLLSCNTCSPEVIRV